MIRFGRFMPQSAEEIEPHISIYSPNSQVKRSLESQTSRWFYLGKTVVGPAVRVIGQRYNRINIGSKGFIETQVGVKFRDPNDFRIPIIDQHIPWPRKDEIKVASTETYPVAELGALSINQNNKIAIEQIANLVFNLSHGNISGFEVLDSGHLGLPTVNRPDNPLQSA